MSSIIYETVNLYNKENNIEPYLYIGSDQHNNPKYLGSSKELIKDIKKLGKENFEKKILCEFNYEIDNITLRKIESNIQKSIDVANNPHYYNKTNSSHKGYVESEEQRKERMKKTHIGYRKWWDSLDDEKKQEHINKTKNRLISDNQMKGKTYEEIYGDEVGKKKRENKKGKNNGMSKSIVDIKTGQIFDTMVDAMKHYGIKKHSTLKNRCNKEKGVKFI